MDTNNRDKVSCTKITKSIHNCQFVYARTEISPSLYTIRTYRTEHEYSQQNQYNVEASS